MATSSTPIAQDMHVTLTFRIYAKDGELLEKTDDESPLSYLHGYGQIVPGLENALAGLVKGQSRSVVVPPELGFGDYDPQAVIEVDRADFPQGDHVHVGDEFVAESPDGEELPITVLEVKEDALVVDTNHPLAGETLRFEVTVLDVRPATSSELEEARNDHDEDEHDHHDCRGHDHLDLVTLGRRPKGGPLPS